MTAEYFDNTLNNMGFTYKTLDIICEAFVDYAAQSRLPCLDVGAAMGYTTLMALSKGAQIIANDLDPMHLKIIKENSTKIAIELADGTTYSYGDIEIAVNQMANAMNALGINRGDRVAVQVEKSAQNIFLYLACLKAGFIYLPLNTNYTIDELSYFFENAMPALIICSPTKKVTIDAIRPSSVKHVMTMTENVQGTFIECILSQPKQFLPIILNASAPAVIIYTSGTTGKPKGAVITHENLNFTGSALKDIWDFKPEDVLLHVLPLFHVHGLFFALSPVFLSSAKMLLISKFDEHSVSTAMQKATVFMGVPTHYIRLLTLPALKQFIGNIRLFISGSAPLLENTFQEFYQQTGHKVLERYGMSEAGIIASNPLTGNRKKGTVGLPLSKIYVRVIDSAGKSVLSEVGDIQVRGNNVFSGYWEMPEKTKDAFTKDGYFKTGDLGLFDEDGYLLITGRSKDLIITGGLNVYPKEIETTLDSIQGIKESAIIGVPHPDFGEGIIAIIAKNEISLSEESILNILRNKHVSYKIPKQIVFVDDLPKNTMGKVVKDKLRKQYVNFFSRVGRVGKGG